MKDENKILHQTQETGKYKYDDKNLQAQPFMKIFITTEDGDVIVDEAKVIEETRINYSPVGDNQNW